MAYLDTNTRTVSPTSNETAKPLGRISALPGLFIGFIKDASDVQKNGRLRVWIPEMGSFPEEESGWFTVNYCSPFAGATNNDTTSKSDITSFEGTQTSYGMWFIPPDINNQVLVMFINGDPARGVCIGCLYNQFMNNMIPAIASSSNTHQYPKKEVPAAEYNKWDLKVTQPDVAQKPFEKTKFKGVGNQGLITDQSRGLTTSSARRESPSKVFGILTPGPVIDKKAAAQDIRRKGGSSFIMDDGDNSEYIQLATKSGAQIKIDETNGYIYLINRDGTAWVQMDKDGNVDIFGAQNISMRAQRDFNIRADRNVNIEAGQNIFIKAAKDTTEKTTEFTFDVNNIPTPKTISEWSYVGEGKGTGGNIVMQALQNWHSTTQKDAFLTVIENDMNIQIGNSLNITTKNGGQNFSSKQGIKATTDGAMDLAAKGNIRIGTNGSFNVSSAGNLILCTDAEMSSTSTGNMTLISSKDINMDSVTLNIDTNVRMKELSATVIKANSTQTGSIKSNTISIHKQPIGGGGPTPPNTPSQASPIAPEQAMSSVVARPAEIKPLNKKINILATWSDPESKFKRNSQALQTTVSKYPTYEPCPEHENFKFSSIAGYQPLITEDVKTYEGSGGAGNTPPKSPAASTEPGADNVSIKGDSPSDSNVGKDVNSDVYKCQLTIHEGLKNVSYNDSVGLLTGGIGHLLRQNEKTKYPLGSPISAEQVDAWYREDSEISMAGAQKLLGPEKWEKLSDVRKRACADLCYNLGINRLSKFVNFLEAMKAEDYNKAGMSLKDSKWYTQVGKRGRNIITMIVNNVDPNNCDKKFSG